MIVKSDAKSALGLGKAEAPLRLLPSDHVCPIFALPVAAGVLKDLLKSLNSITFTERGETHLLQLVIKNT